jgi:hypothetical protein
MKKCVLNYMSVAGCVYAAIQVSGLVIAGLVLAVVSGLDGDGFGLMASLPIILIAGLMITVVPTAIYALALSAAIKAYDRIRPAHGVIPYLVSLVLTTGFFLAVMMIGSLGQVLDVENLLFFVPALAAGAIGTRAALWRLERIHTRTENHEPIMATG